MEPTEYRRYLGLALDPIHVGTGEFQLGRVDNTIVREPATRIPKIPGTSLMGPARAYAAMRTPAPAGSTGETRYLYRKEGDKEKTHRSCAGKGGGSGDGHCGSGDCPVCVTFGFSRGDGKSSFQGMASIFDARILLFPVISTTGPVWVTTPRVLAEAKIIDETARTEWEGKLGTGNGSGVWSRKDVKGTTMRLGWMSVPVIKDVVPETNKLDKELKAVQAAGAGENLAIVAEDLFGALVNDNLEVRTSVSISPETGTAVDGALFTAEAIPRGTVFWFEAAVQNPVFFRIGGKALRVTHPEMFALLEEAFGDMEMLGVGGMNTRGFGRLRVGRAGAPKAGEVANGLE